MTPDPHALLTEVRAKLEAYEKDPERWTEDELLDCLDDDMWSSCDRALFAAAPRLLRALLALVEQQQQEIDRLRGASALIGKLSPAYIENVRHVLGQGGYSKLDNANDAILLLVREVERLSASERTE